MDVDIDHLGEFWSNGCGYRPFLEQWMWICAVFGAMDLEEWIYGGRSKNGCGYRPELGIYLYPPHKADDLATVVDGAFV